MAEGKKTVRGIPAFIVGAASSGSGKTVITLGLMEALRRRGLRVAPFKAGPDYIDAALHGALLKTPSYNLDTWMMGVEGVKKTFQAVSKGAQISVVEGVMGLYDGKDGTSEDGSTAHLARALGIPVALVVNAEKTARSIAAVVKGFVDFDPSVDIRWVVFNRVGSPNHFNILKDAVSQASNVKVIGYIPKDSSLGIPGRHLGLVMQDGFKGRQWKGFIRAAGDAVEKYLDIEGLLMSLPRPRAAREIPRIIRTRPRVKIAVAIDAAFSFYYAENLDLLRSYGADIVGFSPIKDRRLPKGAAGVYLGGGYPELYAKELQANSAIRKEMWEFCASGAPVYAECGGLMYLGRELVDISGTGYFMCGVFPWSARMLPKRKALGYLQVKTLEGCPFLGVGQTIRGHEFHYSELTGEAGGGFKKVYEKTGAGAEPRLEGFLYKSTLASYIHLHFASNTAFARGFVDACAATGPAPVKQKTL